MSFDYPGSARIPPELHSHTLHFPGLLLDTVENSAKTIGCNPSQVAKSIVVIPYFNRDKQTKNKGQDQEESPGSGGESDASALKNPMDAFLEQGIPPVFLFLLSGSTKINMRKVKRELISLFASSKGVPTPPTSFQLLPREEVYARTGYEPGTVTPLGLSRKKVGVYLDVSLREAVQQAAERRAAYEAEHSGRLPGIEVGESAPPPGSSPWVATCRDRSMEPLIFCSAGAVDTALSLSLDEVERWTNFVEWADVGVPIKE